MDPKKESPAGCIGSSFSSRFEMPDNSDDVWFVGESTGGSRRIIADYKLMRAVIVFPEFFRQFSMEWKEFSMGKCCGN